MSCVSAVWSYCDCGPIGGSYWWLFFNKLFYLSGRNVLKTNTPELQGMSSCRAHVVQSLFVDPFRADLDAFIATFCVSADFSIETDSSSASQVKPLTSQAITAETSAVVAIQAPEQTSILARDRGRLTKAVCSMKRHKTSKTAAHLAAEY